MSDPTYAEGGWVDPRYAIEVGRRLAMQGCTAPRPEQTETPAICARPGCPNPSRPSKDKTRRPPLYCSNACKVAAWRERHGKSAS